MTNPTLFDLPAPTPPLPERIRGMYAKYGYAEGETCGRCRHLRRHLYAKTYFKCAKSIVTSGPATDWRSGWDACGLWEETVTPDHIQNEEMN